MTFFSSLTILLAIVRIIYGAPDGDHRLRFSDRRDFEGEHRTLGNRLAPYGGSPSNIGDVFKIPIAVIRGTSAAAQALSPQNTQAIQSIFEIPVTTLEAVGSYVDDTRTRRITAITNRNINNNNDDNNNEKAEKGSTRPLSLSDEGRRERRDRLLKLKEAERRRITDEERFFHLGHHSSANIFSSLADFFIGGGGHSSGHNGHAHGGHHSWKPPKRPTKPFKPGHHGIHGGSGGHNNWHGDGHYQVHEDVNESNPPSWGIFSWLQQPTKFDADDVIQNKIAPGSEIIYTRETQRSS